eukprot:TRINITY_DN3800_c0_g1_i1.p1 TRINITY_DN3800_c0_g1~~TRINITY_DN3800_c0_g1_i1.p1  ORF type:complete len:100 (+),score=18.56 TRINITY_DN3800_c0_g1_i1:131-430(+)
MIFGVEVGHIDDPRKRIRSFLYNCCLCDVGREGVEEFRRGFSLMVKRIAELSDRELEELQIRSAASFELLFAGPALGDCIGFVKEVISIFRKWAPLIVD